MQSNINIEKEVEWLRDFGKISESTFTFWNDPAEDVYEDYSS